MRLTEAELFQLRIPLVTPFETSFGTERERELVLLRIVADGYEGWGECVTMPAPLYSPEFNDSAASVIERFLIPAVGSTPIAGASAVHRMLEPFKGHFMAKAAVEMAILDAELQAAGISFGRYLGAVRDRVPSGVSVGIQSSIPALLDAVGRYLDEGYQRIKLKIKPGWDVEPVRAVRERFGDIPLQVDANTAYQLADAAHLRRLDAFDLLLIEQPLAEGDLVEHAQLARTVTTPLCLDESITSAKAAADAIRLGACSVVNIKAGRVGGYLEARRVHDVCMANGIPVWCGGMVETGLGRAANMALAALPGFTLPGDTSASERFYRQDIISSPFVLSDGHVAVPDGPGLGVDVDREALAAVTVSRRALALS